MWRRFTSTIVDIHQQPIIFPDVLSSPNTAMNIFTFRRPELEIFNWLSTVAPCYPVKPNKISIINGPQEFYETLTEKCQKANRRIVLSSLYLGTGKLEKKLVSIMKDKLHSSGGNLKINVLLDFQRGSRGENNSKTMLLPLLDTYKNSCRISLYHTPHLRGIYKKYTPQRWNELIELQHMKVYLMDDTVIMSGANLSNDYFTNRQDRYIVIEDKGLADFYANLVSEVQKISFQLQNDGSVLMDHDSPHPYLDDVNVFIQNAQRRIKNVYINAMSEQSDKRQSHIDSSDTWVIPLVQAGRLNIQLDSEITRQLLGTAELSSKIRIATGYFNLTQQYIEALTKDCQADCTLLMAHPNANGFKGAGFPAGGVPDAYSLLAQKFHQYVESFGQLHRFRLYEFEKPGWTYHAKGLWYYPAGESLPSLTLIGSPNFGERSVNRDLETQIALITANEDLRARLHQECNRLHEDASEPGKALFERKIPNWVKMTVGVFRNFF